MANSTQHPVDAFRFRLTVLIRSLLAGDGADRELDAVMQVWYEHYGHEDEQDYADKRGNESE